MVWYFGEKRVWAEEWLTAVQKITLNLFLWPQVGSFNYDISKVIFYDEFIADENQIRSVLDYVINIRKLKPKDQDYVALTG